VSVRTKVEPIDRDIAVIIGEELAPEARRDKLVEFARGALVDAQQQNARVLGRVPPHETFVDGARAETFLAVKPDGTIVFEFALLQDLFEWIRAQLVAHSPVLTGRYSKGHIFLADGVEIPDGVLSPDASEWVFANVEPYARKIERGQSPQAPDGVYEAVAVMAAKKFGNLARIRFTYRTLAGDAKDPETRQPAIVIRI
jgi:hypothetical protein